MNSFLSFACIGGDLRQVRVINRLSEDGHIIYVFGLFHPSFREKSNIHVVSMEECLKKGKVVILPLPYHHAGNEIFAPYAKEPIQTKEVLENMHPGQLLLAGHADKDLFALSQLYRVTLIDYLAREELSVRNVIPTVEGAIEIAMKETPYTLHQSQCLVLGYGRIGSYLSHTLRHFGAHTTVAARKQRDFAWIENYGMKAVSFEKLPDVVHQFDVIFNTVPTPVIDEELLKKISTHTLIIDLASKPGGVDMDAAKELGRRVIWALSLPGKAAPQTSGDIIKDTIMHILEEREV